MGASLAVLITFQGAPGINGTEVVRSYKQRSLAAVGDEVQS